MRALDFDMAVAATMRTRQRERLMEAIGQNSDGAFFVAVVHLLTELL